MKESHDMADFQIDIGINKNPVIFQSLVASLTELDLYSTNVPIWENRSMYLYDCIPRH